MKKSLTALSVISSVSAITSACFGLFYSFGGTQRVVENIYGHQVALFGDGIYANDSIMKAATTKGTDIAIIFISLMLLITVVFLRRKKYALLLQSGMLSVVLYVSTCLIMGINFNKLFLLYLLQFGSALFAFIISMSELVKRKSFDNSLYEKRLTCTAVFLIISGCSVFMWLMFIIPSVVSGMPMEIIDVYTTEPTFAIDLAVVLPFALFCGIGLLKKQAIAYQLSPVMLTMLTGVGICIIFQTIMQSTLGIVLETGQLLGLVGSFVIIGTVALVLNIRLLKRTV